MRFIGFEHVVSIPQLANLTSGKHFNGKTCKNQYGSITCAFGGSPWWRVINMVVLPSWDPHSGEESIWLHNPTKKAAVL